MTSETKIICAVLAIISLVPGVIYTGFVFSYLWLWFIVPLGLPAIGVSHAVGLGLIKGLLFGRMQNNEKYDEVKEVKEVFVKLITYFFVAPTISLGLGYAVASWFM